MGDMVASALVQEGVSGVTSYVSSKMEEMASRAHLMARLEMALSQMEFALEKTGKLPITYVSLLCRWKMLKHAYMEGTALLNNHKRQLPEGQAETGERTVTGSSFLDRVIRAAKFSISSLVGLSNNSHLNPSVIRLFDWYADCAAKFVADVESSNPLQHDTFRYPLVRQLLEGKTLRYEMVRGSRACLLSLWPVRLEDRGVEALLDYTYLDMERPEQCFHLCLTLRLSEDTDIVGTTMKCLQLLTSRFKLVTESTIGELTLLPHFHDISHMYAPLMSWTEKYAYFTKLLRPDPICCANTIVSSESSLGLPEPILVVYLEYMLHSSNDGMGRKDPPLYLTAAFLPHIWAAQQGFVLEHGVKEEEYIGGSIQQTEEILRSKAVDCVLRQTKPVDYYVSWYSAHGVAFITLLNSSNKLACPKQTVARRRRRIVLEYGGKEECFCGSTELRSEALDCVVHQLDPTHYVAKWYYRDIIGHLTLRDSSNELACSNSTAAPRRSQSAAKRKR